MICKAGDLVLVPFPFTDLAASKRRPVLVVSGSDNFGDFIGMAVTSQAHHGNALPLADTDLVAGSLPKPSWIRFDRVVNLSDGLVVKIFAQAGTSVRLQAVEGLCRLLSGNPARTG